MTDELTERLLKQRGFYVVSEDGDDNESSFCDSLDKAVEEAKALSAEQPGVTFLVCKPIAEICTEVPKPVVNLFEEKDDA